MEPRTHNDSCRASHAVLDIEAHWHWRNPLNILLALVLSALFLALLGLIV